jgi:plastocyanin
MAQVTGTVKLDGKAPEAAKIDMSSVAQCAGQHKDPVMQETVIVGKDGGLANVVVSIKKDEGMTLPGDDKAPDAPAVLSQKGCQYVPHVVAVQVGQPLLVKNDDPFLHNVHSLPEKNDPMNKAQPNVDTAGVKSPKLKEPEIFRVKCDVHPWMGAWIAVIDSPFFAVSGPDGKFELPKGLPDGDYNVTAWHEKYGAQDGKVTVKDGKGTVDFTVKAAGADASKQIAQPNKGAVAAK